MRLLHQGNHSLSLAIRSSLDFPPHLQYAVEVIYMTEGHATVHCDGKQMELTPGDIMIIFPNQVHSFENSVNVQAFLMIIPMDPYLELFRVTLEQKLPCDPILHHDQWAQTSLEALIAIANKEWKTAPKVVLQGYILLTIGKILPLLTMENRNPSGADALRGVLLYLHEHYKEPITRKQIATDLGYHESYLSHIFTDTLHTTLTDYILNLRISEAIRLLDTTDLTIAQISGRAGFGSIRSFNRAFLKEMGYTPKAYRKR